jgi:hypothetical protein
MWMAGYAARTKPSQGFVHDLWAKALALKDPVGRDAVIITLDLCGIGRDLSNRIRDRISKRGLDRERVVLACSHTHSGPVVGTNLLTMYKLDDDQTRRVVEYERFLETAVVNLADLAFSRLEAVELSWGIGCCDFAVNRRNNKEADVPELRRRLSLKGPVDHDVPVLKAARANDSIVAIVFGYACHCTVLDFYKFCGDYAGFAQVALEERFPNAESFFVAGCGADQNPVPRRRLDLAAAYGTQLADAVAEVLAHPLRRLNGPLLTAYEEIPLAFGKLPGKDQIEQDAKSSDFYIASRARHLLKKIELQGRLDAVYPYPVQVWRIGELDWVFLGGEVVVDYALRLRSNLGTSHTWVSSYCNDVMAYIPSLRVLKEGGYEGATSMIYYGQPTVWSEAVEESVVAAVARGITAVHPEHPSAGAAPRAGGD